MRISLKEHQRVLDSGVDIPDEKPSFPLPLSEVGISEKTVWVDFTEKQWGRLPFKAEILINLPADVRGIHMSRLEQGITQLHHRKFMDLLEYGLALGEKILHGQRVQTCSIALEGQVPILRQTPVSKQTSVDTVDITATTRFTRKNGDRPEIEAMVGAALCHLTACPCTMAYNQFLFSPKDPSSPLATHSQRSKTELLIESDLSASPPAPSFPKLIDCLASTLHVAQDLLKRPDEAELVLKAHQQPQFAEDVVRETARAVGRSFGDYLPISTRVIIKSLSLESIHIHNVRCGLETSLEEILKTN